MAGQTITPSLRVVIDNGGGSDSSASITSGEQISAGAITAAHLDWLIVALLSPVNLVGVFLGAKLAGRVPAPVLRIAVVVMGLAVSIELFVT